MKRFLLLHRITINFSFTKQSFFAAANKRQACECRGQRMMFIFLEIQRSVEFLLHRILSQERCEITLSKAGAKIKLRATLNQSYHKQLNFHSTFSVPFIPESMSSKTVFYLEAENFSQTHLVNSTHSRLKRSSSGEHKAVDRMNER